MNFNRSYASIFSTLRKRIVYLKHLKQSYDRNWICSLHLLLNKSELQTFWTSSVHLGDFPCFIFPTWIWFSFLFASRQFLEVLDPWFALARMSWLNLDLEWLGDDLGIWIRGRINYSSDSCNIFSPHTRQQCNWKQTHFKYFALDKLDISFFQFLCWYIPETLSL